MLLAHCKVLTIVIFLIQALQELTELVNKSTVEEVEATLPSWSHFYKILSVDVDCKVRENTQVSLHS